MIIDSLIEKLFRSGKSGKKTGYLSFAKSLSWRIIGTLDTILVSYWITGRVKYALSIGSVEMFTKICLYYIHERAWESLTVSFSGSAQKETVESEISPDFVENIEKTPQLNPEK